jgi:hypothetical protein
MTKYTKTGESTKVWNIKKDVLMSMFIEQFSTKQADNLADMNLQLFYCFKKLFEMINEDNNCINTHKSSGIVRVTNFSELQGMDIFWGIFNYSKDKEVVKLASQIFVDYHLYIENSCIKDKQQAWNIFY